MFSRGRRVCVRAVGVTKKKKKTDGSVSCFRGVIIFRVFSFSQQTLARTHFLPSATPHVVALLPLLRGVEKIGSGTCNHRSCCLKKRRLVSRPSGDAWCAVIMPVPTGPPRECDVYITSGLRVFRVGRRRRRRRLGRGQRENVRKPQKP